MAGLKGESFDLQEEERNVSLWGQHFSGNVFSFHLELFGAVCGVDTSLFSSSYGPKCPRYHDEGVSVCAVRAYLNCRSKPRGCLPILL